MQLTFHDWVIYVLCFVGLFSYGVFVLTIFSPSKKRYRLDPSYRPKVSIIIPVWNEGGENGARLRRTIESLLASTYPKRKLEIIVVDDGSTDNSLAIAREYRRHGIKVYAHRTPRGKTLAINTGMRHATGELVAGLDADSFVMPDVLDKLVPCFKDPNVMAAVPSITIWKPRSFLQLIQAQEFLSAVFIRHVQSELGGVPMAPGAFTLLRRSFIEEHGLLDHHTMVEDLEISLRIQSKGYLTENVIDAHVYTSGVRGLGAFVNQRLRWFCGFIIQLRRYKHLFRTEYGNLGVFILPMSVAYIFLTVFVFAYTVLMGLFNLMEWLWDLRLIGFSLTDLFEWNFDLFFVTINNTTVLPMLLLLVGLLFIYYIKTVSGLRQGILLPFFSFTISYWFIGSLCWILAIYYYITRKKIRWGPHYYAS